MHPSKIFAIPSKRHRSHQLSLRNATTILKIAQNYVSLATPTLNKLTLLSSTQLANQEPAVGPRPVCSQCRRAGKSCGGYHDISSLVFRSENEKTARRSAEAKSRSGERRKKPDSSPDSSSSTSESISLAVRNKRYIVPTPTIPKPVSSSVEDQGFNFFFYRFVISASGIQKASYNLNTFPFLAHIPKEPPLQDAIVSVGLGALSNITRDRSLQIIAREKYGAVIKSIRQAVGNTQQTNPTKIIRMMVLLSLYEMVSCGPKQIDSWTVHLDGAAALLKQTSFSKALTSDARSQLQYLYIGIIRYFLTPDHIPPQLLNYSLEASSSSYPDTLPAFQLVDLLIRFMKLHLSIRHNPNVDVGAIIRSASALDTEMEMWARTVPGEWTFSMYESNDMENTFYGKYLVYHDVWAARDLNHYHSGRVMIKELILSQLARKHSITPDDLNQRQQALDTIARMATGICAGAASQMKAFSSGVATQESGHAPPLNGVFLLLFPLSVAGSAAAPEEVHEWVVQSLQKIGNRMGIQRALELIPRLKKAREIKRTCDANDAIHITVVQPGETKPQTLSSFHPQFTYSIFGDEEQIFGYKGLIIRLRFAAHDLRPHLHISYDQKFNAVDDTVADDVLETLREFVQEGWF
ncbi:hypothetical protein N7495_000402 [Penicillium taxi]|uniref:uncharacterized protein n=1 Tax=Penicillium taxi TaxID=168475 RepID=UPI00254513DD|nr:uncharacterized protein N7495_000402 [Penicillium taxi]KAJ5907720.1 hypothetical protein N7495_000402 [Penicillium taxi]